MVYSGTTIKIVATVMKGRKTMGLFKSIVTLTRLVAQTSFLYDLKDTEALHLIISNSLIEDKVIINHDYFLALVSAAQRLNPDITPAKDEELSEDEKKTRARERQAYRRKLIIEDFLIT